MKRCLWMVALVLGAGQALADNLEGTDQFLCAPVEAILCTADGICEGSAPAELQIPQFVILDLKRKLLTTTPASAQNRSTPILLVERADGLIVLQGTQMERAFTLLVDEVSGRASLATVADSVIVNVFGACTPLTGR